MLEFLAGVGAAFIALFGVGDPTPAVHPAQNQPASAIVAPSEPVESAETATTSATTTIINQYITQPVIEREVLAQNVVTREELDASLAALRAELLSVVSNSLPKAYTFAYPAAAAPVSTQTFAHSQKIDQLANVTISNVTVSGVTGLTSGDIPDLSGSYLSTTGGTLSGALTLTTPLGVGSGGTGWASIKSGYIPFGNGSSAIATSSSLYWDNTNSRLGIGTASPGYALAVNGSIFGKGLHLTLNDSASVAPEIHLKGYRQTWLGPAIDVANNGGGGDLVLAGLVNSDSSVTDLIYLARNKTGDNSSTDDSGFPTLGLFFTPPASTTQVTISGTDSYPSRNILRLRQPVNGSGNFLDFGNSAGTTILSLDSSATWSKLSVDDVSVISTTTPFIATTNNPALLDVRSGATSTFAGFRIHNEETGTSASTIQFDWGGGNTQTNPVVLKAFKANDVTDSNFKITTLVSGSATDVFKTNGATVSVGDNSTSYAGTLDVVASGGGRIRFGNSSGSGVVSADGGGTTVGSYSNHNLYLRTNNTTRVTLDTSGQLGVGSTTPWRKLSVTGTVGFDGLTGSTGAGSLCLSANNEVVYNSGSDACLPSLRDTKHDISSLSLDALQIVDALDPVSFVYNDGDGRVRYGFIAEDTAAVDSHLVTYSASGTLSGIDDRSITSIVVKAIKELWARSQDYFARTERLESQVSALEARIAALEGSQGAAAAGSAAGNSPAPSDEREDAAPDTEPPVITINGNNPATLQVGNTYSDLGATVADNVDANLGYQVFVGSTPFDQAHIDTSEPDEWHLHYVATDNAGNTATSTRTVIVEAPSVVPTDEPADEPEPETVVEPEPMLEPVTF